MYRYVCCTVRYDYWWYTNTEEFASLLLNLANSGSWFFAPESTRARIYLVACAQLHTGDLVSSSYSCGCSAADPSSHSAVGSSDRVVHWTVSLAAHRIEPFAADGLLVGRKLHQLTRVVVDQRSKFFVHGGLRLRSRFGIARLARRTFTRLQSLLPIALTGLVGLLCRRERRKVFFSEIQNHCICLELRAPERCASTNTCDSGGFEDCRGGSNRPFPSDLTLSFCNFLRKTIIFDEY